MIGRDEDFSGLTETTARVYTAKTLLSALKPAKTGKREAIRVCGYLAVEMRQIGVEAPRASKGWELC